MILTDDNGEPMFVNILKLRVPEISNITRSEDDEDVTLLTYTKGQGEDKEFKLDAPGHATLIRLVEERHNRMRELGIVNDSIRLRERELGIKKVVPADPTDQTDPNARSIKL